MAKQSPHKRWKGCQLCKPHKNRSYGDAVRAPVQVQRAMGRARRWSRRNLRTVTE